jgi:hypothetical protein
MNRKRESSQHEGIFRSHLEIRHSGVVATLLATESGIRVDRNVHQGETSNEQSSRFVIRIRHFNIASLNMNRETRLPDQNH